MVSHLNQNQQVNPPLTPMKWQSSLWMTYQTYLQLNYLEKFSLMIRDWKAETYQRSTTFKTKSLKQPSRDWNAWKESKMNSFQSSRSSSLKSAEFTTAWIKTISSCFASQTSRRKSFTTLRKLKESSWVWSTAPSHMKCEILWTPSSTNAP